MIDKNVIIIGGGLAGLTTAAYLAKAGIPVQVFEQHVVPGGYVSSFKRKGYTFPAGPTCFGSNGVIFPILDELGLYNKESYIRAGHQISWENHDIPLETPRQSYQDIANCFPNENRSLKRYFNWVGVGGSAFNDLLKSGMMFGHNVFRAILRVVYHHPLFPWASWKANKNTNRSLHAQYFKNPYLKQLLNQLGYPVMAGKNTLGMWASYYYDSWVPIGGMQSISDELVRYINEKGGQVHFGNRIKKIKVDHGQVTGVEVQDAEFIAANWVVSASDLNQTCFELIERKHIPSSTIRKLNKTRPSESIFSVFLGLKDSPELTVALKRFQGSHVVFTCADEKYIQLVLLSKDDKTAAPDGKHALFIGLLSPYEDWETTKGMPQAYAIQKAAYIEDLIKRGEEFIPGLRVHIEVQEAASPLTYERYTSNWRGSTAGWNWDPNYAPHFDFAKDIPIKNFYSVGHYVHNPGGVPTAMITAWYISKEIIKLKK
ncbi:MAG: prolycopene isomerase [Fusobacteria bacterium]|nr:MAG: prolycopene isomerase [Fusobacteriota bacterium]KAF0228651.1 MAG: prolycopene [Fusobacteriota bacterium]